MQVALNESVCQMYKHEFFSKSALSFHLKKMANTEKNDQDSMQI